jgi:hypothetical protein
MAQYDKGIDIYSIFGQMDAIVARQMIDEGKGRYIEPRAIPSSVAINDLGQKAQFAIVLPRKHVAEYERRLADLRS